MNDEVARALEDLEQSIAMTLAWLVERKPVPLAPDAATTAAAVLVRPMLDAFSALPAIGDH